MIIDLFHGTNATCAQAILKTGFKVSPSEDDWLGYGIYFFIQGVSCPIENAREWATNKYGSSSATVLKSKLAIDDSAILDLRVINELQRYNQAKKQIINEHYEFLRNRRDLEIKKRKDIRVDDRILTNMITEQLNIQVVIHNTYIKNSIQREIALESSYPNTTVCCVRNPQYIKEISLLRSL